MKKQPHKDIFGLALSAYYHHNDETDIIVHSPDFDDDIIPVPYLFRSYKEMPPLEKRALDSCKGHVLDVGCGAGSHALHLQDDKNLKVTAIDISGGAVEIARLRGLTDGRTINYFELENEKFDTLLFLMNGTGIIGRLNKLDQFFNHTRRLLNPGGKVLIDSSNLSYLFDPDEEGAIWINAEEGYYGELQFQISYKNETSPPFDWLYLDYNSLELAATMNGFTCKLLKEGDHYDYLAQLTPNSRNV